MATGQIQGLPAIIPEEYDARTLRVMVKQLQQIRFNKDDFLITGSFVKSTSNDTPLDTQIYGLDVGTANAATVRLTTIASTNNHACTVSAFQWAGFQRVTNGNIALVGSVQGTPQENSGGSPTVTMVADTTNQTIAVRVTGENGAVYTWRCMWEILKQSN